MQRRIQPGTIGSIAVGVQAKNGVVVSGSKKASYGTLKVANVKVVTLIDDVAFAFAGQISDLENLVKNIRYDMKQKKLAMDRRMTTSAIANMLGNILYANKLFPYISFILIGGYDTNGDEGPHLFTLDPIGSVMEEKYTAGGFSQDIAIGLLEDRYEEGLNIDEAQEIVEATMKTLASRDVLAGSKVDIARITKEKAELETKTLER